MTLPDGWKEGRLGKLCSIEIGGTPSRGVAAYWDSAHDTSNVWVSIRDMRQRLITGSAEQISDLGVKKSNVKLQQPGTVLLSFKTVHRSRCHCCCSSLHERGNRLGCLQLA